MTAKFKLGDVVKLLSGSELLTVTRVFDVTCSDMVRCEVAWFANGELRTATLPEGALRSWSGAR